MQKKLTVKEIEDEMRKELSPGERKVLSFFKQKKNTPQILARDSLRRTNI